MKIDMPNTKEINFEIDNIIEQGLVKKQSFYSYLKNIYRQVGFRYLFHDGLEIALSILIISSILISIAISNNLQDIGGIRGIYAYIFTVSPILYLTLSALHFIDVKQNKTYEIEMTCKYDIYQISAFRMLTFSIVSIMFNVIFIYIISYIYGNIDLLKAFIISIASLFIFSIIFLFMLNTSNSRCIKYLAILGWIGINISLYIVKADFYIELINNISIYIWLIVISGSIYGYIGHLKKFVMFRSKEGVI